MMYPDWEHAISFNCPFIAPENGLLYIHINEYSDSGCQLYINGTRVFYTGISGAYHTLSNIIPINKNDKLTYNRERNSNLLTDSRFIPYKR